MKEGCSLGLTANNRLIVGRPIKLLVDQIPLVDWSQEKKIEGRAT